MHFFIPTAAIDADAIEVLPKCMNDLLKVGITKQNIRVFDLHQNMPIDELKTYDVVCLTGGRTSYLLERINDTGFRETLLTYIRDDGFVIGVSAGSIILPTICREIWNCWIRSWMFTAKKAVIRAGYLSR